MYCRKQAILVYELYINIIIILNVLRRCAIERLDRQIRQCVCVERVSSIGLFENGIK